MINKVKNRLKPKLVHKIILVVFLLLAFVLFTAGLLVERIFTARLEERFARNALDIAHAVAEIPQVIEHVGQPGGHLVIQPLADGIRKTTSAEFVVVMDMNSIRYSHPVPERIGQRFVGGDEGRVLRGETYTSKATGTLGPSLRAFVPLYRDGRQVGAVSVGIMINDIQLTVADIRRKMFLASLASLVLGMVGSWYLAQNIKKAMMGLEPHEISALLHQREAVLQSVREGIVAVDHKGRIILVNNEARRMLQLGQDILGQDAATYLPGFPLGQSLKKGEPVYDVETHIHSMRVLSNTVPIKNDKGQVRGAIISFRDMTEVRKLAEELTGVMKFIETVRVQNHEFSNKLHTIAGLIQLGEYDRAIQFISSAVTTHRHMISFVSERIKDPAVAAVLLGKAGKARELGVTFHIHPESCLGKLQNLSGTTLVTIIGNLIDNALDAVANLPDNRRNVEVAVFDEFDSITISVKDSGPGVPEAIRDRIFEKGFSTRAGEQRGLGLYIVKSILETLDGEIAIEKSSESGTEISVYIPNKG